MKVREKVGKSRNTVFFQWCVAPEGRKVGPLKRRVRSHLARWEIKKLHAVVARSTFPSQNFSKHHMFGPLLEVAMWEKCTPLWREAHFEVKMHKAPHVRATFGSCNVEKVYAVVARSTFRIQNVKSTRGLDHFWRFRCRFTWQVQGIVHLVKKWAKPVVL